MQKIYVFLSASTHRWNIIKEEIRKSDHPHAVPKRLSDTRWSARADAVKSLSENYEVFRHVLELLSNDELQKNDTRSEAASIVKSMNKLENGFMTSF